MNNLSVLPIVGLPQFDGWSQVVEHRSEKGLFVCSFSVSGQHAGNIGRDLVAILEEDPPSKPRTFYSQLQAISDRAKFNQSILFLSAALFEQGKSLLAVQAGTIFLKRSDRQGIVVESQSDLKVVEGNLLEEDVFVLLTEPAYEYLPEIKLKFEQGYDAPTIATSIVPAVHRSESASTASIAVIYRESKEAVSQSRFAHQSSVSMSQKKMPANSSINRTVLNETPLSPAKSLQSTELRSSKTENKIIQIAGQISKLLIEGFKYLLVLFIKLVKLIFTIVISFLPSKITSKLPPVKVRREKTRWSLKAGRFNKRRLVAWSVLLLIVFGISWGLWHNYQNAQVRKSTLGILAPYNASLEQVRNTSRDNPVQARAEIEQIKVDLNALLAKSNQSLEKDLINQVLKRAELLSQDISGLEEISALPQFYDLRLARSDFVASVSRGGGNQVVFLDRERKQLLVLNLENKAVRQLEFDPNQEPIDVLINKQGLFVLASGVFKLSSAQNDAGEKVNSWQTLIESSDQVTGSRLMASFDENLYLFNPDKRNIFRFTQTKDGYKKAVAWLKSPLGIDFNQVTSIAVDGDFWIASNDGQIKKFTSGREQPFKIIGLSKPFNSSLKIVTTPNLENLYVLEADQSRIVVLKKNGEFLREIDNSSLGVATDLVISEDSNSFYVVSGSLLYQLEL